MTQADGANQDAEWVTMMLGLPPEERSARIAAEHTELAALGDDERKAKLRGRIEAVYARPDTDVRTMTEARLRAWLDMDPEKAAVVGRDFEITINAMSADVAMRRVAIVQSVAGRLHMDEQTQLRHLVPGVMGDEPVAIPAGRPAMSEEPSTQAESSRPWWAFWRR